MTEEIIIDGVNVVGCNAYKEGHCLDKTAILLCDTNKCSNYNDCYYKQLKRLEQENIINLKQIELDVEHICELNERINKLEQENKQMKSALEEILESAKFAQCLPCGSGNLEDCLNCDDETTNNGQFCMEKRIYEIKTKCVEVLNESN